LPCGDIRVKPEGLGRRRKEGEVCILTIQSVSIATTPVTNHLEKKKKEGGSASRRREGNESLSERSASELT